MPLNQPSQVLIDSGTFTGNDADNRQVTTGFKCNLVIIHATNDPTRTGYLISSTVTRNLRHLDAGAYHTVLAGSNLHASDGFVVSKTSDELNWNAVVYSYFAMGQA